jgi:hypothetical protein
MRPGNPHEHSFLQMKSWLNPERGRLARVLPACPLVAVAVVSVVTTLSYITPANAIAEETHVFNPTLSLTGDCATNAALDSVPDPGCPGGAHPPKRFKVPRSIAIDEYGDIFIASKPVTGGAEAAEAVIDVFDSSGFFLTEIVDGKGAQSIAVDSEGHLYAYEHGTAASPAVVRYDPEIYDPASGSVKYAATPVTVTTLEQFNVGIAIDASTGHLYVDQSGRITEYGSATEGNPVIAANIGAGVLNNSNFVAIDAGDHSIIAGDSASGDLESHSVVRVFSGETGHALVRTIDGSCLPARHFGSNGANPVSVAVDESTGNIFVDDRASRELARAVYEFTAGGQCVATLEHSFEYAFVSGIAIDNGAHSPNGALDSNGRYLFVPSGELGTKSHVYAFEPARKAIGAPAIESISAADVTESEARLQARVNPEGRPATYRFEYVTQQAFEGHGFEGASLAGEGKIAAGSLAVGVAASAVGLSPGALYRFRIKVLNCPAGGPSCEAEAEASFATFPAATEPVPCSNESLRAGPSLNLPDCRVYELVTPNTNGHRPLGPGNNQVNQFATPPSSPDGNSLAFLIVGGAVPGDTGAGSFNGDLYVASRSSGGWTTEGVSPTGAQSEFPIPGGLSPDHGYAVSRTGTQDEGSLAVDGQQTAYVRYPDGRFHITGSGSLATDLSAEPRFIADNGTHILFESRVQLEAAAPASGMAIYDRTADEVVHVVSLLPGNATPPVGQGAFYLGASAGGNAVAFKVGESSPLYVRLNDAVTFEVAPAGATFAGLSASGEFAFYLLGGDIFRFDTVTSTSIRVTASSDATVVNVPAEGTSVYFTSPSFLAGAGQNSQGDSAIPPASGTGTLTAGSREVSTVATGEGSFQVGMDVSGAGIPAGTRIAGASGPRLTLTQAATSSGVVVLAASSQNLYRWDGAKATFVAAVTKRDVEGELTTFGSFQTDGLGLWVTEQVSGATAAANPSRTTPDGATLLFGSRAQLTGYASEGSAEIYRFEDFGNQISCLSCARTNAPPSGDATLLTSAGLDSVVGRYVTIPNLSANGKRAFFQTPDQLAPIDTDGVQDVYEWEAAGEGTCGKPGGCVFLISSGQSPTPNYLFGVSETGNDVFFSSTDSLTSSDPDETASVYDARVLGGFPGSPGQAPGCRGEACQPPPDRPADQTPASSSFEGPGNVVSKARARHCPKGKKAKKVGAKTRCVAKKKHRKGRQGHAKSKRANAKGRAGR